MKVRRSWAISCACSLSRRTLDRPGRVRVAAGEWSAGQDLPRSDARSIAPAAFPSDLRTGAVLNLLVAVDQPGSNRVLLRAEPEADHRHRTGSRDVTHCAIRSGK